MRTSESIAQLAEALSKFLSEVVNPKKNKVVDVETKAGKGNFSYSYTTLDDILDNVRPLLSKYELAITQDLSYSDNCLNIVTLLMHSSGQFIESSPLSMPITEFKAQAVGSAITYGRRYSLNAILSIASEEDDDDGSRASGITKVVASDEDIRWFLTKVLPVQLAKPNLTAANIYHQFNALVIGDIEKEKIKELLKIKDK